MAGGWRAFGEFNGCSHGTLFWRSYEISCSDEEGRTDEFVLILQISASSGSRSCVLTRGPPKLTLVRVAYTCYIRYGCTSTAE